MCQRQTRSDGVWIEKDWGYEVFCFFFFFSFEGGGKRWVRAIDKQEPRA